MLSSSMGEIEVTKFMLELWDRPSQKWSLLWIPLLSAPQAPKGHFYMSKSDRGTFMHRVYGLLHTYLSFDITVIQWIIVS